MKNLLKKSIALTIIGASSAAFATDGQAVKEMSQEGAVGQLAARSMVLGAFSVMMEMDPEALRACRKTGTAVTEDLGNRVNAMIVVHPYLSKASIREAIAVTVNASHACKFKTNQK